CLQHNEDPLTF
nr:immunoglobulin light chain junction region [Mus musculus]NSL98781.1 immunoglobulin light chain junction region [Mus musculus]NSL99201.1 immunoglobulin light chain junction region [Mus musculus]NSL99322.1 immunoglobulin light chain junction region [Mus musculus]NSL99624.1 immunoglobulin light chain junction region [Mus musculus]